MFVQIFRMSVCAGIPAQSVSQSVSAENLILPNSNKMTELAIIQSVGSVFVF